MDAYMARKLPVPIGTCFLSPQSCAGLGCQSVHHDLFALPQWLREVS
jgi:hypothetical protein